jgi:DNA-binding NarL/FixJ family response regulator
LKALHPEIAAVVLSMHDESDYAVRALSAGALGYVMKKASAGEIIAALRKAFRGEQHISESMADSILLKAFGKQYPAKDGQPATGGLLSDRELEVFEHLGHGKDTKIIAASMGLSPKTVETHRMHIKDKLGINSLSELIQQAAVWVDRKSSGA